MKTLIIKQVDAFTSIPFSGNPAGVITDADELSKEMMQRVAEEINLSESAFITIADEAGNDFRLRFFTPTEEVNLSGHATIASCYALLEDGRIPLSEDPTTVYLQTNAGTIQVDVHYFEPGLMGEETEEDKYSILNINGTTISLDKIMMHQQVGKFREAPISINEIAEVLGIEASEISSTGLPLEIAQTGLTQLMVPVLHKETLLNMHPDLIKLGLMNKRAGIDTNHIFTLDTFDENNAAFARHFAPAVGMWEDPATGTAAAGLSLYLLRHGAVTSYSMVMEQGKEVASLAKIYAEVDEYNENGGRVKIGGKAVTSITRKLSLEDGQVILA